MNVNEFIAAREQEWQQLETLLQRHRGRARLSPDEIRTLGTLYRAVVSDLAIARRDYDGQRVTVFLNQLLTRAHSTIYQTDTSNFQRVVYYFRRTIPQAFRQSSHFTFVAFLLFIIPAIVGYVLAYGNPDVAATLGLTEQQQTLANRQIWTDIPVSERPYASSFIMTNNIRVAVLAFGGGMIFGLFSIFLLSINGLMIGATMGLAAHYGLGQSLFDFVIGHGVIELSVIFISGGAGLQLGWALINPGFLSRRDAVALAGQRVLPLVVISILLLVVAGLIEGFISPSSAPFEVKMVVGVGSGLLMYAYLLSSRLREPPNI